MPEVFVLGGRYWRAAEETTARHDDWIMLQVAEAGLEELPAGADAREMLLRAVRSGRLDHLLAGLLVERDTVWSPGAAERNAEHFASLTTPEDKAARRTILVRVLADFFSRGLGFSRSSRRSSGDGSAPSPDIAGETAGAAASTSGATSSAP